MRKCYFLLAILALLLQATQLHAVEWLTANGTATGPDGKKFWQNDAAGGGYISLPSGTQYCRIYQDNGEDGDQTRNFPDGTLRFRIAKAMGYETPTGYGNTSVGGYTWNKSRDLYITKEQAQAITVLDLSANGGTRLTKITGIQIFENLEELYLSGNNLRSGVIPLHVLYPKKSNGEYDYANPYHPWTGINPNQRTGSYSWTDPFTGASETRYYEYRYLGYMLRFFPHLTYVDATDCYLYEFYAGGFDSDHLDNLEHVDLSNNPGLYHVDVDYSHVDYLNLSGCTGLTTLFASRTDLASIDLTGLSALKTLYMPNNSKLTTFVHSGTYDNLIYMDFKNCPLLTEIDHLDQCPNLQILKCQNCSISTLDLHADSQLKMLLCSNNYLTTLDVADNALVRLECANNQLTSLDCSGATNVTLKYLDCSGNQLTNIDVTHNDSLETLYCYSNQLSDLDITKNKKLKKLRISNNPIDTLDVTNNPLIEDFYCNNCGLNTISGFDDLEHLQVCKANNNNLTQIEFTKLTALETLLLTQNKLTEMDMTPCTKLKTLFCDAQGGYNSDGRWLKVLKLNSDSLTALKCDNNALLSLDLSNCSNLTHTGVIASCQRDIQDIKVYDHSKVCIELPNGAAGFGDPNDDPLNYFYTWSGSGYDLAHGEVLYRDGKYWLSIYNIGDPTTNDNTNDTKADVDLYGKTFSYCYYILDILNPNDDENLGKTVYYSGDHNYTLAGETVYKNPERGNENISVKIYPYVMHINPLSADNHSLNEANPGSPFYSGTIYLDYDAVVPAGTEVYIAKKININKEEIYSTASGGQEKVVADQLQLVKLVPGAGATEVVVPAYTPVYVKSATETGLFSFDRNNHGGIVQPLGVAEDGSDLIANNIFKGVLTDSTGLAKYSVLALGRGRPAGSDDSGYTAQSRIGFWPSSRTVIPAHRAFIPIEELEKAGVNNSSPGLLFSFTNDIDENTTTGIRTAASAKKNEGWYTINGVRLTGRPTEKGVYIHNGRKEVIR
ncbi:hypothetical protein C7Y71_009280 [Pseudoprevotella muciniphila]|uniref:Leucine-rich repeat domain-containing protein n=1 Tax=Pseudoprevotella muciniphila TaxID=2133944 RepID=A0A5P8E8A9_9BACT|nr:hypothetical protein C7Y71_009280 [Pseudoprevotella muciniphila]